MCKYHIVFTPKYRRKIIYNQYKADIRDIIKQLCSYKGIEIIEGHLISLKNRFFPLTLYVIIVNNMSRTGNYPLSLYSAILKLCRITKLFNTVATCCNFQPRFQNLNICFRTYSFPKSI